MKSSSIIRESWEGDDGWSLSRIDMMMSGYGSMGWWDGWFRAFHPTRYEKSTVTGVRLV